MQKGDFVYLPAGVVHALKKGSIVYEIQQATDITYRFFDYHRVDAQGHERPLQLEEAIGCVDYTLTQSGAKRPGITHTFPHASVTTFVANDSFCVRRYVVFGTETFHFDAYDLRCGQRYGRRSGSFHGKKRADYRLFGDDVHGSNDPHVYL